MPTLTHRHHGTLRHGAEPPAAPALAGLIAIASVLLLTWLGSGMVLPPTPFADQATAPPAAQTPDDQPDPSRGGRPELPPDGTFTWLEGTTHRPVTWECQQIPVRLVRHGAPDGAEQFLAAAADRLSAASGAALTFTAADPIRAWGDDDPGFHGITVGWEGPGSADLTGPEAGLASVSASDRIFDSDITIRQDQAWSDTLTFSPDGVGEILLHELGHAAGLGHVDPGTDSLMTPYTTGMTDYSPTDRAALAYLGWAACR